jgi:hypothetical protein
MHIPIFVTETEVSIFLRLIELGSLLVIVYHFMEHPSKIPTFLPLQTGEHRTLAKSVVELTVLKMRKTLHCLRYLEAISTGRTGMRDDWGPSRDLFQNCL